jgi:hypothetical protein
MPAIDTKHLTYGDFLLLSTITQRYDLIDGEMAMAASPISSREWLCRLPWNPLLASLSPVHPTKRYQSALAASKAPRPGVPGASLASVLRE